MCVCRFRFKPRDDIKESTRCFCKFIDDSPLMKKRCAFQKPIDAYLNVACVNGSDQHLLRRPHTHTQTRRHEFVKTPKSFICVPQLCVLSAATCNAAHRSDVKKTRWKIDRNPLGAWEHLWKPSKLGKMFWTAVEMWIADRWCQMRCDWLEKKFANIARNSVTTGSLDCCFYKMSGTIDDF